MEYVGKQFVAAQLQGQQRIGRNHYILLRLAVGQQANKLGELFDHRTLVGGQLSYYYNTIFGPLGGSIGYSNRTKKAQHLPLKLLLLFRFCHSFLQLYFRF